MRVEFVGLFFSIVGSISVLAQTPATAEAFNHAKADEAFNKELTTLVERAQGPKDSSVNHHLQALLSPDEGEKLFRTLNVLKDRMGLTWLSPYVDEKYLYNFIYYRGSEADFEEQLALLGKSLELRAEKIDDMKQAQWELGLAIKAGELLREIELDTTVRHDNAWDPIPADGPRSEFIMSQLDELPLAKIHVVPGYGVTENLLSLKKRLTASSLTRFLKGQILHVTNVEEYLRLSQDIRISGGYQYDAPAIKKAILFFKYENFERFLNFRPKPTEILEAIRIAHNSIRSDDVAPGYEYIPDFRRTAATYLNEIKMQHLSNSDEAAATLYLLEGDKRQGYLRDMLSQFNERTFIEAAAVASEFPELQDLVVDALPAFLKATAISGPQRRELIERASYLADHVSTNIFCSLRLSLSGPRKNHR
jgi:hypothetical protein